ncbi:MAG: hypothetical protein QW775_02170 [Ignisphaera sp.]|uniref:Serine/threonine protein kinase n=1 Tax=Ignisphaera aggregans TaxID=334771 RepID=A0A7C4JKF6_9CREN
MCYPTQGLSCCKDRINELRVLGVETLYSFGKTYYNRDIRILGKGHSAIVALAKHVIHGIIALKVRRLDSKRFSMEWEARVLEKAQQTGFAPKLYGFSINFLLREYIDGCTLEEFLDKVRSGGEDVRVAFRSLLRAALAMDLAGVDLVEISNPLNQVVYLCCDPGKPFFIDFESARFSAKPLNVTKVVSFIVGRLSRLSVFEGVDVGGLILLARKYKECSDNLCREDVFNDIIIRLT